MCVALISVALAADVSVVKSDSNIDEDGKFSYSYELSDGSAASESGNADRVQGSYKFTSPEGESFVINYVADENGYQPEGSSLPVGPEVPPQILRALEYIRTHPAADRK